MYEDILIKWLVKPISYLMFWLLIAAFVFGLKQLADGTLVFGPGGGTSGYGTQYDN